MSDLTGDLLAAVVAATPERKEAALRVLRGEVPAVDEATRRLVAGEAEPFQTLREIGRRLTVSPCSLWRWGVPGHELGGRRRFRMSEVEAYLASDAFKRRAIELREKDRARRGPSKAKAGSAA